MNCIIYGLSSVRKIVEESLNKSINIIGYSDSFHEMTEYNFKKFYKFEELTKVKFDVIIIAINSENVNLEVKNKLIHLGIDENKIITIYEYNRYYFKELKKSNEITKINTESAINGLIFGISYA